MDRRRALSLVVVALVGVLVLLRLSQTEDERPGGCDSVRLASLRAKELAAPGRNPPVSADYRTESSRARAVAVTEAPSAIRQSVHQIADSLSLLARHLEGFDPGDPATYDVVEQRSVPIEQAQATLDTATASVDGWFASNCS